MPMLETLTWIYDILANGAKVFRHHECPFVVYERTGSPNPRLGLNKHTTNSWKTVPVSTVFWDHAAAGVAEEQSSADPDRPEGPLAIEHVWVQTYARPSHTKQIRFAAKQNGCIPVIGPSNRHINL
jgi:hypothetical protein